jgi:DNA (cytosine-5)-methyltransferase 1
MVMRLLDLFSGIGGFSYAAEKLVGGYETVAFCEQDEFCQKVLRKHWKDVPIYDDVRTIDAARLGRIDIVAGGFPCQAVSQAGLQKATEDDRWLWDEMLRIIQGCKPRWVIGENVVGLININEGVLFEQVQTDLEKEGYSVQSVVIPACAKNAPHRRDRVWIIGNYVSNTESEGLAYSNEREICETKQPGMDSDEKGNWSGLRSKSSRRNKLSTEDVANTEGINRYDNEIVRKHGEVKTQRILRNRDSISNTQGQKSKKSACRATQRKMGYLDDGISRGLLRHFDREPKHIPRVTTGEKDRAKKLKALGNSIVPQVVAEIFNAIKVAEHGEQ